MSGLKIGLHNPHFAINGEAEEIDAEITVRTRKAGLTIRFGNMLWDGKVFNETFVLEIDLYPASNGHADYLGAFSFGAHLFEDYAEAARQVAKNFCMERRLQISEELSHWPLLQFIVSKPREEQAFSRCSNHWRRTSKIQKSQGLHHEALILFPHQKNKNAGSRRIQRRYALPRSRPMNPFYYIRTSMCEISENRMKMCLIWPPVGS